MVSKTTTVWLTRNNMEYNQWYGIHSKKPARIAPGGSFTWDNKWFMDAFFSTESFRRMLPRELRLKPGGGPVKIKITIEAA